MGLLQGQVAVVTGAGTGVGQGCALALASEDAALVLVGRREAPLAETAALIRERYPHSPAALITPCDVTSPDEVRQLIEGVLAQHGRIDILLNNAGFNVPRRTLAELSWDDWQQIIRVNLDGCYLCSQAVLPTMRAQGRGTLIHIGSNAIQRPSRLAGAAYTASKAGLTAFSGIINAEERPNGIRSSVITLGETNTPLLDKRPQPPPADVRQRALQPEDVGACIRLIATLPPRAIVEELALSPSTQTW